MKPLLVIADSCLNIPYLYGGKNPLTGFDCSGLIEWILDSVGMSPPGVANAQALHDWFIQEGKAHSSLQITGSLVFYGKSVSEINHVSMMLNDSQIIEAGGGDQTTKTLEDAKKKGACVRRRPYSHRQSEIVAVITPNYPGWLLHES